MVNRGPVVLIAALLVLGMIAVTPVEAVGHRHDCDRVVEERILLPTFSRNPPPIATPDMGGVILWWIHDHDLANNKVFYLWPESEATLFGAVLPDFNIAFYSSVGTQIERHNDIGKVTGTIPSSADHAIVWMYTGPGVSPDQFLGAEFIFVNDCNSVPGPFN